MNSIDRQQPEDNHEDLRGADAVRKIREVVEHTRSCFFCTTDSTGAWNGARPMSVRHVDDDGNLWFLSASDSRKNAELAREPSVQLYFQGASHADFMCLSGEAHVSTDRARIHELWEPLLRVWFTEGIDDPRITVIMVRPVLGHYWDTKHGAAIAGIKMLLGAMLGTTLDDSVEGRLVV
jgi:general stress protein 26